jgi:hypothetical protein
MLVVRTNRSQAGSPWSSGSTSSTEVATKCIVDVVAGADGDDQNEQPTVVDLVADAVVAHSDSPDPGMALEWSAAWWPRITTRLLNGVFDRVYVGRLPPAQLGQELVRGRRISIE